MSNFMKMLAVGAQLFHTDRQTDRHDEANSPVSYLCDGAKCFSLYGETTLTLILLTWRIG